MHLDELDTADLDSVLDLDLVIVLAVDLLRFTSWCLLVFDVYLDFLMLWT